MVESNLILVDGICGSGKSTTAQLICLDLVRAGYPARWYYEHQAPHPVSDRTVSSWRKLAESVKETGEIVILESALFQTMVGKLQLEGRSEDEICDHIAAIETAIADANPCLVYFYQRDVDAALQRIRSRRGDWFDEYLDQVFGATAYAGNIGEFFRAHRKITDKVFAGLKIRKLAIDNTDEAWPEYNRRIASFLSLSDLGFAAPTINVGDLSGRFRHLESGDEIKIATDGTRLFLDDEIKTRLIQRDDETFWIQGMCIEIEFQRNGKGEVNQLTFSGDLPELGKIWLKV